MKYWAAFAVMSVAVILSLYFIQRKKIDFKEKNFYLSIFITLILFVLNFEFTVLSFRIIMNVFIYIVLSKLLFKCLWREAFLIGISILFVNVISEIIYALLSYKMINLELFIYNNSLKVFVDNFFIGLILTILSSIIGKLRMYNKLLNFFNKINDVKIIVFSLFLVVSFNFFIWISFFVMRNIYDNGVLPFIGSMISIFSSILVFVYLKINSSYKEVAEKYDLSLKSIEEYEKMIDTSKLVNHETRNQFLTIRNMSNNKKITNYIDSLLDNKINDNEQLLMEVSRLPRSGIRGLIYSKLLDMKEKKINYNLLIDKKISMNKFSKIEDVLIVDICKILGVFLDNAIEAVELLKEKDIIIEIYADKKDIVFSITNNFVGELDLEVLSTTKYSTKGNGRGYGLSLVKDIINKSNKLENSTEIYEDNFTQILKIKM